MARFAFLVHPNRPEAAAIAADASDWLVSRGHSVVGVELGSDGSGMEDVDLVVSCGGDGNLLRAVSATVASRVPILGVNIGHLGYLTQCEPSDLVPALEMFLAGQHQVEERMTLEVRAYDAENRLVAEMVALNEAVVEKTVPGHTVRIRADIDAQPFVTYAADGLLVATPTGSTAYNLSSRGPILSPRLRAIVLTPVSPHMLFDRPLVLEPTEQVTLEVLAPRPAVLVIDGISVGELEPGSRVECSEGVHPARLVTVGPHDFHAILRAKFSLADR